MFSKQEATMQKLKWQPIQANKHSYTVFWMYSSDHLVEMFEQVVIQAEENAAVCVCDIFALRKRNHCTQMW